MVAPFHPLGSFENPYTVRRESQTEANGKYCRCARCGRVEVLRPLFDFYGKLGEPLTCEVCTVYGVTRPTRPATEGQ